MVDEAISEQSELESRKSDHSSGKRTKLEDLEPRTPLPLTESNLALLPGKMSPPTYAENSSKSVKSTDLSDTRPASDIDKVRHILTAAGLLIGDDSGVASVKGKNIVAKAKQMITSERHSPKPEKRIDDFLKQLKKEELSNEDSFMSVMWWILVSKKRTIKTTNDEDQEVLMIEPWANSHLRYRVNNLFARGWLPDIDPQKAKELEILLAKSQGLTTPKPDLAYGFDDDAFNRSQMAINTGNIDLAGVSKNMWHPFFIVEFKGFDGVMAEAKHQACRGGAVLITTICTMKEKAGMMDKGDGYDDGSFVFSLTLNNELGHLWVHWREVRREGNRSKLYHHMYEIGTYLLNQNTHIHQLRNAIFNILDWGCDARKAYVRVMLDNISKVIAEADKHQKAQSQAGESSAASEKKRKLDKK